ncbi:hypothetical protein BROUX41_002727 [Berkeleyomyces rouxiae]|uniref:uncharacterized protein n=1 Tax=Berkeleyomyces rouxiae TaxID=2035830 RepID=UPI003B8008EB
MAHAATRPPTTTSASTQPHVPTRHNEYFIDRDGIDREVITADICRYLGNDALVRPGVYEDPKNGEQRHGYFITAYRNLTSAMIEDLKNDSARWERERLNIAARKNNRNVASPVHGANGTSNGNVNMSPNNSSPPNGTTNGNGNLSVNSNGFYANNNNAAPNSINGPRRSNSPATNSIAPPPPPQAHGNSYQSSNTYNQRPEIPPMTNGALPPHDYPDRRDMHDAPRYTNHHPQQYPGSAPPSGYGHPPPPPPPSNNYNSQPDQSYPGGPYPPPPSMSSYSAPPTQSPYGGPPPAIPEYATQQPYISSGANHQGTVYPPHDRMGASAPPPQNGYAAGQPPSYPPGPPGYQTPYPPPPPGPGATPSHYESMKPSQPMDPIFVRSSYQDRTNSPPVNKGPGSVPGGQAPPIPSKSPQGYAHNQYAESRGPYSQPPRV